MGNEPIHLPQMTASEILERHYRPQAYRELAMGFDWLKLLRLLETFDDR